MIYPRQSRTTHTERLGDEASVYDWAHAQVHALNPTAACVWGLCDGATSPVAIAAALQREMGIPEAEAVVDLTLKELARLHLLELPVESLADRPAPTRRWLLERGLAAALLPAVYTILTPSPLEAQSPGGAPTLTSVSPNQGTAGTTVAVTLTGTNFVAGSTTVNVSGGGVTVLSRRGGSVSVVAVTVNSPTSLTANFQIDAAAAAGARTVTVTTPGGTSGGQTFTIIPPPPTLTNVSPNQGIRGATIPVTLTGTNFIVGATTVAVNGGDVTVNTVVVGSGTSLTANFALSLASAGGARTVTVTTAGGTSGPQTFTINLPTPGSTPFSYTGGPVPFVVPAGVGSITIVATGAQGGVGFQALTGVGGLGGRTTATVPVTPSVSLTVRVGGAGSNSNVPGGAFNGGGGTTGFGGGGGGASSVHVGSTPLVIAGGGGGGGGAEAGEAVGGGNGGAGGGLVANAGATPSLLGGGAGGGGTQSAGGAGGAGGEIATPGASGTAGVADLGGTGGRDGSGIIGGGGGGGGYFGGGGGGGGNENTAGGGGGGGGSSFTAPGASSVSHEQGVNSGNGSVTISW